MAAVVTWPWTCRKMTSTLWLHWSSATAARRKAIDAPRTVCDRAGERSIYFFDPDNNRLQITAHAPNQVEELLSDQEKWRRIVASRKAQGRGLSRWESGGKKVI